MNRCDNYCQPITDNNNNTHVNPYINSIYKYDDSTDYIITKADSGATSNYWQECDKHVLSNQEQVDGLSVTLLNNSIIKLKERGIITLLPLLPSSAAKGIDNTGFKKRITYISLIDSGKQLYNSSRSELYSHREKNRLF